MGEIRKLRREYEQHKDHLKTIQKNIEDIKNGKQVDVDSGFEQQRVELQKSVQATTLEIRQVTENLKRLQTSKDELNNEIN